MFLLKSMLPRLSCSQVITDSLALHSIATKLRKRRFESGALRLNNTRLQFQMDSDSHQVLGYSHYIQQEANQLVEEFMLLANMQVAAFIADAFPTNALLRWVGLGARIEVTWVTDLGGRGDGGEVGLGWLTCMRRLSLQMGCACGVGLGAGYGSFWLWVWGLVKR